ncbi:hypothetical protein ACFL0V_05000 [Nanoarchaeota archaeon]
MPTYTEEKLGLKRRPHQSPEEVARDEDIISSDQFLAIQVNHYKTCKDPYEPLQIEGTLAKVCAVRNPDTGTVKFFHGLPDQTELTDYLHEAKERGPNKERISKPFTWFQKHNKAEKEGPFNGTRIYVATENDLQREGFELTTEQAKALNEDPWALPEVRYDLLVFLAKGNKQLADDYLACWKVQKTRQDHRLRQVKTDDIDIADVLPIHMPKADGVVLVHLPPFDLPLDKYHLGHKGARLSKAVQSDTRFHGINCIQDMSRYAGSPSYTELNNPRYERHTHIEVLDEMMQTVL